MKKNRETSDLLGKITKLLQYQNKDSTIISQGSVLLPFELRMNYQELVWYLVDPGCFHYTCWDNPEKVFKGTIRLNFEVLEYNYQMLYKEVQDKVKDQLLSLMADNFIEKEIFLK